MDFRKLGSLLVILAVAFVFTLSFGPGSSGCQAPISGVAESAVATVNGKEIPVEEFRQAYQQLTERYRAQGLPSKMMAQLGFHKQVLNQLVERELLAQAAEKHGIAPTDQEIAEILHKSPYFQKDGKFDLQTYRDALRNIFRTTDVEFERDLRRG